MKNIKKIIFTLVAVCALAISFTLASPLCNADSETRDYNVNIKAIYANTTTYLYESAGQAPSLVFSFENSDDAETCVVYAIGYESSALMQMWAIMPTSNLSNIHNFDDVYTYQSTAGEDIFPVEAEAITSNLDLISAYNEQWNANDIAELNEIELISNSMVYNESAPAPATNNGITSNIFEKLGDIATAFALYIVALFDAVVAILYTNNQLTIVGILALIGVGTGLVIWAFNFIRRLIRIKTKR